MGTETGGVFPNEDRTNKQQHRRRNQVALTKLRITQFRFGCPLLCQVAQRNGVSRETVRTQLRAMLAKTGTRRQGELLMVLQRALALPAVRPARR